MKDVEQAIAQVSDIRAQLAASTQFRGYAPEALVTIAIVCALLAVAQAMFPASLAANSKQFVVLWGGLLVGSNLLVALEAVSRSRWQHGGMAEAMMQSAMRSVLPFSAAGIVFAVVVWRFAPETVWIVPGTWLLLISLVAFSMHATMPRSIVWPALWYLFSGTTVLVLAGRSGQLSPWMMGVPLTFGHLALAWVLRGKDSSNAR